MKAGRLVAAALFCSGMDVGTIFVLFLYGGYRIQVLLFGVAIVELFLGAWIAYGRKKFVQGGGLLFGITALFAGFFQIIPIRNVGLFCLMGAVLLPLLAGGIRLLFRTKQTQRWIYEAKLYQNGEEKVLFAFMDTGNRLRLPGSGMPVVLVDKTYLTEWINTAEQRVPQKLVFLPYKGVGGTGMLHGVRLQCALNTEDGKVLFGEVAAVAAEHRLFQNCEYQMILQPEILEMACVADTQKGEKHVI